MVASKFYQTPDKKETPAEPEKKTKKARNNSCLALINKAASVAFVFARM